MVWCAGISSTDFCCCCSKWNHLLPYLNRSMSSCRCRSNLMYFWTNYDRRRVWALLAIL